MEPVLPPGVDIVRSRILPIPRAWIQLLSPGSRWQVSPWIKILAPGSKNAAPLFSWGASKKQRQKAFSSNRACA